jgi:hypothetical protein
MASNSINCYNGVELNINFSGRTVNNGEIWSAVGQVGKFQISCVEITDSLTDNPLASISAQTQYTNCYDCYTNNYGIYILSLCNSIGESAYFIDVSQFGPSFFESSTGFTQTTVFYLEFLIQGQVVQGCFSFGSPRVTTQDRYESFLTNGILSQNLIGYTAQTDCETCITNSPLVYEVRSCDGITTYYVSLPTDEYVNNLISFTDGIDEFCGNVKGRANELPTHTFVSDYGKNAKCNICQDQVNTKYRIVNCVDSNINYTVYGSQLFQNGQVSNLSFNEGCFEVSGTTEDPIDLNLFFDYEPHNDCNDCIECSGVFYQYSLCSDPGVLVGEILSYQVIPIGGVFWHPYHSAWCIRETASNSASGVYDTFYSVFTGTCDSFLTPVTWSAAGCDNTLISNINIVTDGSRSFAETVQAMWSTNKLFCVTLAGPPSPPMSGDTYFSSLLDVSNNNIVYTDCLDCYNNTNVGVTTINCNTSEVGNYNLTYLEWGVLTNFGGFGSQGYSNLCFNDIYDNCWTILECPTSLGFSSLIPVETYFNCPTCKIFNPEPKEPPRSANTEINFCQEICTESGTTVVTIIPPHPIWTDGYGTQVTELNMITLGGENGLNN